MNECSHVSKLMDGRYVGYLCNCRAARDEMKRCGAFMYDLDHSKISLPFPSISSPTSVTLLSPSIHSFIHSHLVRIAYAAVRDDVGCFALGTVCREMNGSESLVSVHCSALLQSVI